MHRRFRYLLACLPVLAIGAVALAQGYQPNFVRNFVGPISVTGDLTATGDITGQFISATSYSASSSVTAATNVIAGFGVAAGVASPSYLLLTGGSSSTTTIAAEGADTSIALVPSGTGSVRVLDEFGATVASINTAGYVASTTPHTLTSLEIDAAASVATYGGHKLPARAFTVTGVTGYVSGSSGGGAGNTTWRISDGTNNCDCNFPCQGGAGVGSNASGTLRCAPTGTCAFAASVALTVAVQTAGCTVLQPTIQNLDVEGNWQ